MFMENSNSCISGSNMCDLMNIQGKFVSTYCFYYRQHVDDKFADLCLRTDNAVSLLSTSTVFFWSSWLVWLNRLLVATAVVPFRCSLAGAPSSCMRIEVKLTTSQCWRYWGECWSCYLKPFGVYCHWLFRILIMSVLGCVTAVWSDAKLSHHSISNQTATAAAPVMSSTSTKTWTSTNGPWMAPTATLSACRSTALILNLQITILRWVMLYVALCFCMCLCDVYTPCGSPLIDAYNSPPYIRCLTLYLCCENTVAVQGSSSPEHTTGLHTRERCHLEQQQQKQKHQCWHQHHKIGK